MTLPPARVGSLAGMNARALRIALPFCLLIGLTGASCSGNSGNSSAQTTTPAASTPGSAAARAVVNAASARTISLKTASLQVTLALAGGPDATVSGPFDLANGVGQLTLEVSGAPTTGAIPNPSTLLYDGGSPYLKATGSILTSFDGNKPWAQLTTASLQQIFCLLQPSSQQSTLAQVASGNPGDLLHVLDTPAMSVTPGRTTMDNGVHVTEYTATIDPAAAEKTASGPARQLFAAMVAGGSWSPFVVGIGPDEALSSLTTTFTSAGKAVQVGIHLSHFGTPVSVTAPSPAEIGPLNVPGGCATS